MPRYFSHIHDKTILDRDEFSTELPDMQAVRTEARRTIAGFMMDEQLNRHSVPGQVFEVVDTIGTWVLVIPFDWFATDRQ